MNSNIYSVKSEDSHLYTIHAFQVIFLSLRIYHPTLPSMLSLPLKETYLESISTANKPKGAHAFNLFDFKLAGFKKVTVFYLLCFQ